MKVKIYNVQTAQVICELETINDVVKHLELNAVHKGTAGEWSRRGEELIAVDENDLVVDVLRTAEK